MPEQKIVLFESQCAAAERIRRRFGLEPALEYLIGEKFFTIVRASERHPDPSLNVRQTFAISVQKIFTRSELRDYFDHLSKKPRLRPRCEHEGDLAYYARIRRILGC